MTDAAQTTKPKKRPKHETSMEAAATKARGRVVDAIREYAKLHRGLVALGVRNGAVESELHACTVEALDVQDDAS